MNLVRKKVILRLLDCVPKSANEIANEIGESLAAIEVHLTGLVSENVCEKVNQDEASQYIVRKDVEPFAQLIQVFLSNEEEQNQEKSEFVTSKYYLSRIDRQLVDYVIRRFHLDSAYQTDEDKEALRRVLLASPSALFFALHGDTAIFGELLSSRSQLDASDSTRDWFTQILRSQFMTPLLEKLIADMKVPAYGFLYAKLQLQVAKVTIQVGLATAQGKYVEAGGGGSFCLAKAVEDIRAGQMVRPVNSMSFSDDGLAFLHLGEFQTALDSFDKALAGVQNPIQKAIVLNNKGLAFLRFKQYQKAIECFEEGIELNSGGQISQLRTNKQLAEEYLARANDTDNLTQPTQIRFVQGQPVPFEETRFYEFKEVKGRNPVSPIQKDSDEYAVAFLNREGGRIFWGVRDSDRITMGVTLNEQGRDRIRARVSEKLGSIQPPISVGHWQLEFHNVHDLQGEAIQDLWVIELVVLPPQRVDIFYTNSGKLFVKTEGGKKKLQGQEVTVFILNRVGLRNVSEAN